MAKNILVPIDDSGPAGEALEYAVSTFPDASITALHVLDVTAYNKFGGEMGFAFSGEDLIGRQHRDRASALLADAAASAENEAREIQTEIQDGHPATVIVNYAEEEGIEHIVIGSHGRTGVKRILLGSVAEAVIRQSPVPVTVVREI